MFEEFAELIPKWMLDRSGKAFGSGIKAFEGPSDIYILTAHPGGDPEDMTETVKSQIEELLHNRPDNWSTLRDEAWGSFAAGEKRTQKSLLHFFDGLRKDAGLVPTSSLVFLRARSTENLQDRNFLAEDSWPFHRAVIEKLGVKAIVCVGKDFPGEWVRHKLGGSKEPLHRFRDKTGKVSLVFNVPDGKKLVEFAYPDWRTDWTKSGGDYARIVRRALGQL